MSEFNALDFSSAKIASVTSKDDKFVELVSEHPFAIYGIKNPSMNVCKAAVCSDPYSLNLVKNKTRELIILFLKRTHDDIYGLPKDCRYGFNLCDEFIKSHEVSDAIIEENISLGVDGTNEYFHVPDNKSKEYYSARFEIIEEALNYPTALSVYYIRRKLSSIVSCSDTNDMYWIALNFQSRCESLKCLLQDIKSGELLKTFTNIMKESGNITAFTYEDCKEWNDVFCSVLSGKSNAESVKNIIRSMYPKYKDFADLHRANVNSNFKEYRDDYYKFYSKESRCYGSKIFLDTFDSVLSDLHVYCHYSIGCYFPEIPSIYALYVLTVIYISLAL